MNTINKDIVFFSKQCKSGISVFLNQIVNLNNYNFFIEFYFYKKNLKTHHPKNSHFINYNYPENYLPSIRKIIYFFDNLIKTNKIIRNKKTDQFIFACDLYSFIILSLLLFLKQKNNIFLIYLIEINIIKAIESKPLFLYRFLLKSLIKIIIKRANFYIFPSVKLSKNIIREFKINSKKTIVIPYGINFLEISRKTKEPIKISDTNKFKNSYIKLFYIGRLDKQKDFMTILKAFKKIVENNNNVLLYVIGDGDEKNAITDSSEFLDLKDKIYMLGWKNNIFPYLKFADIFLFSSLYEGFGIILLEIMASKIPIVATDSPYGPSEILDYGKNGILVSVKDYEKMANKTLELIKNKTLRKKYVKNSYKKAKEFSYSVMLNRYANFFNSATNSL